MNSKPVKTSPQSHQRSVDQSEEGREGCEGNPNPSGTGKQWWNKESLLSVVRSAHGISAMCHLLVVLNVEWNTRTVFKNWKPLLLKAFWYFTVFCKCSAAHSVCWDLYRGEVRFLFQLTSNLPLHGEEQTPEERFVLRAHRNNTEGNTAAAVTPHHEPSKTHVCHLPSSLFLKSP